MVALFHLFAVSTSGGDQTHTCNFQLCVFLRGPELAPSVLFVSLWQVSFAFYLDIGGVATLITP